MQRSRIRLKYHLRYPSHLAEVVSDTVTQLQREIAIQRSLSSSESGAYRPLWHERRVEQLVAEKVRLDATAEHIGFSVWNEGVIAPDIARRIFQRNFSTKADVGRGIGTYSMKLFGEEVLGGKVEFTSSEQDGAVFTLLLPVSEQARQDDA